MGRKKELHFHLHEDCINAHLIKYTGDPLIAECMRNKECHVAATLVPCTFFKRRVGEKQIEYRKKRIGITDIEI